MIHRILQLLMVTAPALSLAQTGSGSVAFDFLSFSGPMALSTQANAATPANWITNGVVNGLFVNPTGWADAGRGGADPTGYVLGNANLGGADSVRFHYSSVDPNSAGANLISFTPSNFTNVSRGQNFVLGTLTYQNGFWYGGGETAAYNTPVVLDFSIRTISDDGPTFNQTLGGTLRNVVNVVPNDAGFQPALYEAEADWVYLSGSNVSLSMGAFRVFDNCCKPTGATNVATVEVLGRFNSLDIDTFGTVEGGGFVTASVDPLPIPEPGTWALMLLGLAGLGAVRHRRVRRDQGAGGA